MTANSNSVSPVFSVIITSFNDGEFINEAIESVNKSTFRDFEIILVDDCSTDAVTREVLDDAEKQGHIVIRKEKNSGVGNSRNTGIRAAKGNYILTLDADDRIAPTYLEKAFRELERGFSVVYCDVKRFGALDTLRVVPAFSFPLLLAGNFIASCSAFTKSVWEKSGGYDTQMPNYEDWEFWISLAEAGGTFIHINEPLFEYRAKASSKIARCIDPEHRAGVVNYVCKKHDTAYRNHVTEIVPYLHKVISALENDMKNQAALISGGDVSALIGKLRYAEEELLRRTAYYENSFFWKLKKITEKLRGK
jgi:glycosyltransferase involved in cell wall biosynthesis